MQTMATYFTFIHSHASSPQQTFLPICELEKNLYTEHTSTILLKKHFNTLIILQVFDNEKMILQYYNSIFTQRPPFLKQLRYLLIIFFD